jgi:hypothetical protein
MKGIASRRGYSRQKVERVGATNQPRQQSRALASFVARNSAIKAGHLPSRPPILATRPRGTTLPIAKRVVATSADATG